MRETPSCNQCILPVAPLQDIIGRDEEIKIKVQNNYCYHSEMKAANDVSEIVKSIGEKKKKGREM